jgi:hypothetical protein
MATGKKMLFGALLTACACSVYGTTNIVHDAARDLVLNTQSRNVYTNFYGGVWSFMRSATYNGARTLLPSVRYRTGTETDLSGDNFNPHDRNKDQPVYWERGPAKDNSSSPCFSVNPSPWADTNVFMRGAAYPTIQPGELSCHPGPIDGSVNQCIALRFTVPRDGAYTVTAKAWNRNAGWTAVALFVNGTERSARRAWKSPATAVVTNDFSLATATYAAGDTIEMSIDGNNTFNSNATGLDFRIVEEVEAVYDASSAFLANLNSATPANPYTDAFGTWSAYFATNTASLSYAPTNAPRILMNNKTYTRLEEGGAMAGLAYGSGVPYVLANITDAMATETNSAGKALTACGRAFLPGELNIFPSWADGAATILEVRPSVGGVFDVGVSLRDMFYSDPYWERSGANVWLLQGGEVLAKTYISVERGGNYSSSTTFFFKDVRIMPQIPLAVAVDNNGNNNSDGTGTFWAFIRTGDFSATYDANAALKANMTSTAPTNPFTHNGATWTAGLCANGWKGTFTPYTVEQKRYHDWFCGWSDNASASPFWAINVKGSELTPGDMDGNSILGVGSDMMLAHPKNDASTTALRFTVPADGVYSVTAWLADLAYRQDTEDAADTGVDVHLVAEGHHADSAIVKLRKLHTGQEARRLAADRLFLRKDETMTFAVGRNGSYQWDMTGSFIWIDPESDAASLQGVNIDLDCKGAGTTYAGTGRVGYAGERWNGLAVEDGAAGCESKQLFAASGTRTGVTLALAKTDDALASSATNLAMDTTAAALFADGVVSTNSTDVNAFTLAGLLPNTKYELYFFSRALTNAPPATAKSIVRGTFAAGGTTAVSAKTWFADSFGDYARIDAVSNADGEIAGTFRSASATDYAFWCGLQILGPGFAPYIPKGATIIIR